MLYLILAISSLNLLLGLIVVLGPRPNKSDVMFFLFSAIASAWIFNNAMLRLAPSDTILRIAYGLGLVVATGGCFWTSHFINRSFNSLIKWIVLLLISLVFIVTSTTPLVITSLTAVTTLGYEAIVGPLFPLYGLFLSGLVVYILYLLSEAYFFATDKSRKAQVGVVLIGGVLFMTISSIVSFFIPFYFHTFAYTMIDNLSFSIFLGCIFYAIFKHNLFTVRIIAAELFTFFLWLCLGVRALLSSSAWDLMFNLSLLAATVAIGVLLIRSVIKEIYLREQAEEVSRERSELMAFATHELRNPVTAMHGYASLIMGEKSFQTVDPQVQEMIHSIYAGSNDVLRLITQFLNKSKLELGQIDYMFTTFDAGEALYSIVESFKPVALQKKIEVINRIDPHQKYVIRADEIKLRENVGDLIDNAIKYTKEGNVTVSIERHGVQIRIVIADTGVGIPVDVMPHLFKKFSRADAKKANLLGTGVGLYLAKTLIEGAGGRVWAESEGEGKGSRFIIEFAAA